jgi:hypothetical protein
VRATKGDGDGNVGVLWAKGCGNGAGGRWGQYVVVNAENKLIVVDSDFVDFAKG